MTFREWLERFSDARGIDEEHLWEQTVLAEQAAGSESFRGIEISKANDLIAFVFSYYSVGVLGAGHALVHGGEYIIIAPQWADHEKAATSSRYDAKEMLAMELVEVLTLVAAKALEHCRSLEGGLWPDGTAIKSYIEEPATGEESGND